MLGVNPNTIRQEEDFYATNPKSLEIFLEKLKLDGVILSSNIWECACGQGHLAEVLKTAGYNVRCSDLVYREYADTESFNFMEHELDTIWNGDILTNPPFKFAEEFVVKALNRLEPNKKLLLFLKIQFLEGQKRKLLFEKYPPKYVYCYSSRQQCAKDAEFEKYTATTQFYSWFVWEKGYTGETIIRWI